MGNETIFSTAADACDRAKVTGRDAAFRFAGIECRATPDSTMRDVVEIWFWKGQFEKWQAALAATLPARKGGRR